MRRCVVLLSLALVAHAGNALAAAGGGSSSYSGGGSGGGGGGGSSSSSSDGTGGWDGLLVVVGMFVFLLILGTILTYGPRTTAWQWVTARLARRAHRRRHRPASTERS